VWIGKRGVTENQIREIEKQLKKKRLIKVKILKSALVNQKREDIAEKLAEKTRSRAVDVRGLIVTLSKTD
jgi:RNA-binding protein